MASLAENPHLIDEEQVKEKSPPPHPTTPVSEKTTQISVLMRSRPFGTRTENFAEYGDRTLFEKFRLLLCMEININYI